MPINSLILQKSKLPASNIVTHKRNQSAIKRFFNLIKDTIYINSKNENKSLEIYNNYYYFSPDNSKNYKYLTFTFGYIALAAKLILLEGDANEKKIETLIASFSVTPNHISKITELFYEACLDNTNEEKYAVKIKNLFATNHKLLQQLLNSLAKIATSGLFLTNKEMDWLLKIGNILGFTNAKISEVVEYHLMPDDFNPYVLLGLNENLTLNQLNKNYRNLAFIYHPDNLLKYNDIAKEYIKANSYKFNAITKAYEKIKKYAIN